MQIIFIIIINSILMYSRPVSTPIYLCCTVEPLTLVYRMKFCNRQGDMVATPSYIFAAKSLILIILVQVDRYEPPLSIDTKNEHECHQLTPQMPF